MAIDQLYSFDGGEIEHYLAQIEFEKVLCFAAACAEHMAPTITLWPPQTSHDVERAIRGCWETLSTGQPLDTLPYIEDLELAYQKVLNDLECDFTPQLPFVEDAIVGAIYMLEYAKSQQVNFAVLCAKRAYVLADQLACKTAVALTDQHPSDEALLVSIPVQTELYQQQRLLDELSSTPMELLSIDKLRKDAQDIGAKFFQWILDYCELENSDRE